jgi:hypothetical protein
VAFRVARSLLKEAAMPTLRKMTLLLRALAIPALLSTAAAAGTSARMSVGATVVSSARVSVASVAASSSSVRISVGARQHAAVMVGSGKSVSVPASGAVDLALPRSATGDVVVTVLLDG